MAASSSADPLDQALRLVRAAVEGMRDAGQGDLLRQFEQLKKQLEGEGLFAAGRKQALPAYPVRIGVVTDEFLFNALADVADDREPVIRVLPKGIECLTVGSVCQVQIRGREQAGNGHINSCSQSSKSCSSGPKTFLLDSQGINDLG